MHCACAATCSRRAPKHRARSCKAELLRTIHGCRRSAGLHRLAAAQTWRVLPDPRAARRSPGVLARGARRRSATRSRSRISSRTAHRRRRSVGRARRDYRAGRQLAPARTIHRSDRRAQRSRQRGRRLVDRAARSTRAPMSRRVMPVARPARTTRPPASATPCCRIASCAARACSSATRPHPPTAGSARARRCAPCARPSRRTGITRRWRRAGCVRSPSNSRSSRSTTRCPAAAPRGLGSRIRRGHCDRRRHPVLAIRRTGVALRRTSIARSRPATASPLAQSTGVRVRSAASGRRAARA